MQNVTTFTDVYVEHYVLIHSLFHFFFIQPRVFLHAVSMQNVTSFNDVAICSSLRNVDEA